MEHNLEWALERVKKFEPGKGLMPYQEGMIAMAHEIRLLRADIESLKRFCGVYASGWRSPYARPAVSATGEPT